MEAPKPETESRTVRAMRRGFFIGAAVLIGFGGVFSWVSWQAAKRHEALYLGATAELAGKSLDVHLQHYGNDMRVLARKLVQAGGDLKRVEALLLDFKQANPDLVLVTLIHPEGKALASTEADTAKLPNYGDQPSFRLGRDELRKGTDFNVGRATFGTVFREWILPLRHAVRDSTGRLTAIITASLPLARQQSVWQDLILPENTALGVLRDDGFMVSRFPTPQRMNYEEAYGVPRTGKLYDHLREFNFPERGYTSGYNSVAKADYVFAFRRLPHHPLTMFVSTPLTNVTANWWRQMQYAYGLLGLLLAGSYGLYRWAAKRQVAWDAEKAQSDARFEFLAQHDALTELPNRTLIQERFKQVVAYASRAESKAAVMFLDLDHFKTVNDSLGHPIGDRLLQAVARRLGECLRDTDVLARQGGDEFLIVLSDIAEPNDITVVAEKILSQLLHVFPIEGNELSTSLSMGIAVFPDDGEDFDTLLKKADTAMYKAKEAGRNTFRFYTEQMNLEADEHLRMRHWLRQGIEYGHFVLHYQPQFDLKSGKLVGAEALIRLDHPEIGLIPPARFISVAENSGQIVPISQWVLREACRQAATWRRGRFPNLVVAVNLSAVQFLRGDIEHSVNEALAETGLDPAGLELELTESILIEDTENVLGIVRRLTARGIRFSIDDFGTGYSSLAYLKRFAVHKVKIDQSFVRDVANDTDDAAIVGAIIQMARSLGLKTIAEGVEDKSAVDFLGAQGCDEVQGYLYGRPVPASEFESRFASEE